VAGLEELPPWAQTIATVLMALAAAVVWIRGISSRAGSPAAPPKDSIVLGAAIADSAAIRGLADAIRDLRSTLIDRDDRLREQQREVLHELREICDHLERMQHRHRAPPG
jgi:hypothetical protein